MAAYNYYHPDGLGRPGLNRRESETPLSIDTTQHDDGNVHSSSFSSNYPYTQHHTSNGSSTYNASDDVPMYKSKQHHISVDSYLPEESSSNYPSTYDLNRNYAENIPLSEHPQQIAGHLSTSSIPDHQPKYGVDGNLPGGGPGILNPAGPPPIRHRQRWDRLNWRGKRMPLFCWIISFAQITVFVVEIVKNAQLTGSPIEIHPTFNPMIGPSPYVMINTGARFVPCMKTNLTIGSPLSVPWPCPNLTSTDASSSTCPIQELCGFGGFTSPDQWFRFITPMFLHAGIIHITFNLLIQLRLGVDMEREIGILRFGTVYLASGIFGFILGGNFAPQGIASTGASGALFGIFALNLLDLLYSWKERVKPWKDLMFIAVDVIISLVLGLLPGIDNFSHIGGFLMGLALGLVVMHSPPALAKRISPEYTGYSYDPTGRGGLNNSSETKGFAGLMKNPVNFFSGRKPLWWVWWLVRAGFLTFGVVATIVLLRNFYIYNDQCSWCKHLTCLPISNWCNLGELTTTTQVASIPSATPAPTSPARLML